MRKPLGSAVASSVVAWCNVLLGLMLCAAATSEARAGQTADSAVSADRMRDYLQAQVTAHPEDGSAWRLLGRLDRKQNRNEQAQAAFQRAVALEPESAAAQFDLAEMLMQLNRGEAAAAHFAEVVRLAPDSTYAAEARTYLAQLPHAAEQQEIQPAGFEIKRFDSAKTVQDDLRRRERESNVPTTRPYSLRLQTGAVYNTNVGLAPISRDLFPGSRASAQVYLEPELEYRLVDHSDWRAGPTLRGYFNLNEGGFREFNLQSYQPGFFVERSVSLGERIIVPRWDYEFSHDEFDGDTFGNRHALTASVLTLWSDRQASSAFWAIDHTDFADDGVLPSVTSPDGWTNTLGVSHTLFADRRHLRSLSAGVDLQRADTRGTNFSYNGIALYAAADVPLAERWSLWLHGGWGFRDYFDFEFSPSRNEHVWQAGAEVRRRISDRLTAAVVFHFDRFDSRNRLFDAERVVSGLELTFEY